MRYEEYRPRPSLANFVDAFWTITSGGRRAPRESGTILPDGSVEIVLSFADPVRPSRTRTSKGLTRFVVGQLERPWRVSYTGRVELLGIRLQPAATRTFVPVPQHGLANRVVSLRGVAPDLDETLRLESGIGSHAKERIENVGRRLAESVRRRDRTDDVVRRAVDRIRASDGNVRIADVARAAGVSARQLERKFLRDVGLSPKRWCRVVRFQGVLVASSNTTREDWADVAHRLGYADQAHLVREFVEFTGTSPTGAWWTS